MADMLSIYNTLTRKIETFVPLHGKNVGIYSCGPTVYDYQHIGHMRRYVGDDIVIRSLLFLGYKPTHVMNVTDVGHLVSDSDTGEDKMEKGARKFGKNVWDVAKMFEEQFKNSCKELNISLPKNLLHATAYIQEQIDLIKILEKKGFVYIAQDGVYFDTARFPHYFQLSLQHAKELRGGSRVTMIEDKKNITDFALWKFSPKNEKRQMEWDSPWGRGFPGWHIECSAMSMKALGATFDIHTGGIDHINIHHTNEIAQSEAATGKQFVKYWIHHNFLIIEGEKMSKSLGNFYTVQDIIDKGYDPMSLRYLYLQTHYRQEMNFTWDALSAAQTAYHKLLGELETYQAGSEGMVAYEEKFIAAINDDFNMPKALAVVWELIKLNVPSEKKAYSIQKMDQVLGLCLFKKTVQKKEQDIPQEVHTLAKKREALRKKGDFEGADRIREQIMSLGFLVRDTQENFELIATKK